MVMPCSRADVRQCALRLSVAMDRLIMRVVQMAEERFRGLIMWYSCDFGVPREWSMETLYRDPNVQTSE